MSFHLSAIDAPSVSQLHHCQSQYRFHAKQRHTVDVPGAPLSASVSFSRVSLSNYAQMDCRLQCKVRSPSSCLRQLMLMGHLKNRSQSNMNVKQENVSVRAAPAGARRGACLVGHRGHSQSQGSPETQVCLPSERKWEKSRACNAHVSKFDPVP